MHMKTNLTNKTGYEVKEKYKKIRLKTKSDGEFLSLIYMSLATKRTDYDMETDAILYIPENNVGRILSLQLSLAATEMLLWGTDNKGNEEKALMFLLSSHNTTMMGMSPP